MRRGELKAHLIEDNLREAYESELRTGGGSDVKKGGLESMRAAFGAV